MSQLKEILEKERERGTMEQCTVIHLFREGTFYRAYKWSAWLCLRYFTELKVTHRLLKGGEDIIFVGFPLTSIDRYTPEGAEVFPLSDKSIEMTLPRSVGFAITSGRKMCRSAEKCNKKPLRLILKPR